MRVAVIGSGIGGIGAAWLLSADHHVDLYEADNRLGGHTNTVQVQAAGLSFPVDTGFMVFNRRTYPNLTRFFEQLGIPAHDADMSFSARVEDDNIEWSGTDLNTVFAQRKNLANPKFLRMLADVVRFDRQADELLADPSTTSLTLGQLLDREGYSAAFRDWYLVPMGSAIWSTPPGEMLAYPAHTFLHFCDNHGLLRILGKPAWLSVRGGASTYIPRALRTLSGEVFTGSPVERVARTATGVQVVSSTGEREYDIAVLATHPPQTRDMLGDGMTPLEREILGAFDFWPNDVVVHTDTAFLPRSERAWASWNWLAESTRQQQARLILSYRLNTLQDLPAGAPNVIETLNNNRAPAAGSVLHELQFEHPKFTREAIAAQGRLNEIQGADRIYYAGAWTRYGFHEDGLLSGVRVAEALGARLPWGDELDRTRTMVRPGAPVPMMGQTRTIQPTELPKVASEEATHE